MSAGLSGLRTNKQHNNQPALLLLRKLKFCRSTYIANDSAPVLSRGSVGSAARKITRACGSRNLGCAELSTALLRKAFIMQPKGSPKPVSKSPNHGPQKIRCGCSGRRHSHRHVRALSRAFVKCGSTSSSTAILGAVDSREKLATAHIVELTLHE